MKRVLVTGATGFVGRHTLSNLIGRGFEVFAVSSRPETEQIDGVQWLRADLLNADRAESVVAETRPSHLLHLAWHPSVPGKFWNAPENFSWVQASIDLLDAFVRHGGRRVVSAGTCAEYDWNYGLCVENRTPLNPRTPYGVCKHGLQAWQSALCEQAGVSSAWGRPFLMYGPFEHPGRLVASVINALLTGRPALCSAGTQIRDLMHIQDVADAFAALLDCDVDGR